MYGILARIRINIVYKCHDLVKWLSYYFYFSFELTIQGKSAGKYHMLMSYITVTWQDITGTSHDENGKVVYRPCSSCISSIQNSIETPLSSYQLRLGVDLSYHS